MDQAAEEFFKDSPQAAPLYFALERAIRAAYPEIIVTVQKSQISFGAPRPFCWVWLPIRKGIKGRPPYYLIVSFGLDAEIRHERVIETVRPYPGRFTHHTIISEPAQIDPELMGWIGQSYRWKTGRAL